MMGDVCDPRLHQAGEIPGALGVEVVILDGDDRFLEIRRDLSEVDVNVAVAVVVEDVDEGSCGVVDVRVDLRLHIGDGRRAGQLALVRAVAGKDRADGSGADRREHRDRDEDDPQHPTPFARGAQMPVGAGAPASQFRPRRRLRSADSWVVRAVRANWGAGAVRQARPAPAGFRALVEAQTETVECI